MSEDGSAKLPVDEGYEPRILLGIDPTRIVVPVFILMTGIYVVLLVLDFWLILSQDVDPFENRLFNLAGEDNLATYVAINQGLLIALTAWESRRMVARRQAPSPRRIGWTLVALFLLWLTLDDALVLHERVGGLFGGLARDIGFPGYAWHLLVPLYGIATVGMVAFLWKEFDPGASRWLLLVTLTCFATAVALDFVEALRLDHPWNPHRVIAERSEMESFTRRHFQLGSYLTLKHVTMAVEEVIEMFGMTVLWVALLGHVGKLSRRPSRVERSEQHAGK